MRYGLASSGRFYLRASSLKISLPCEETDRKAVLLALVIAALCICGLASPLSPFPFKREGSHESLPEHPSPCRQTPRHPHNVLATAAACPQHDHVDPPAGNPLHAQFRWSHAVLFEPTHETETALNAAPLIF